jgi:transcriptional regulator with GAF, ATPase, and Fis domain
MEKEYIMTVSEIDENEFFREATLRLCGTLHLEKALDHLRQYVEKFIPTTRMTVDLFEPGFHAMRPIAQSTLYEDSRVPPVIPLSEASKELIEQDLLTNQRVIITNETETHPVNRDMTKFAKRPDVSYLAMYLEIDGNKMGVLAIQANGRNRFTKYHAHLFSLLHAPAAVAVSNALRYEEVLTLKELQAEDIKYLNRELLRFSGDEIIGRDFGLKGVMEKVFQVAPFKTPILLLGETGTGKEIIANAIHFSSPQKDGPYIKINCGAIPETLMDSELFGHEKGAFTGAALRKRGLFERAHQGTIFLDEIGELQPSAQTRLLRVLENHEIKRVGGTETIPVDARIIVATHRNLEEMVAENKFRQDLWFRLNIFPIVIPPLRERKEDIHALIQYFVARKSKSLNLHSIPLIAPEAIDMLKSYNWPGNVRELENMIERALIEYRGQHRSGTLKFPILASSPIKQEVNQGRSDLTESFSKLDEVMSIHIRNALKLTNGKIKGAGGAADLLGINPNTLRGRMEKLGIYYKKNTPGIKVMFPYEAHKKTHKSTNYTGNY